MEEKNDNWKLEKKWNREKTIKQSGYLWNFYLPRPWDGKISVSVLAKY